MSTLRIRKPFDPHVHGRDDDMLNAVAPFTARQCWGAIFEPNLKPPITTGEQARAYRQRILAACADYPDFQPFVLAYLTDTMTPSGLGEAIASGDVIGAKFYPRGATTNSASGIRDVRSLYTRNRNQYKLLRAIAEANGVLQLHCELNFKLDGFELDPYRKEAYFYQEALPRIIEAHPDLRISCEHLTCMEGAQFIRENGGPKLGCSITAHHLLLDRRDMFRDGLRPHLFCLPVLKAEEHWEALSELALSDLPFVYAGTDSAPHDRRSKEAECCSGGIFTAHAAIELYAQAFYEEAALHDGRFERFVSVHGPQFYGLDPSDEIVELSSTPWTVDSMLEYSSDPGDVIRPFGYDDAPDKRRLLEWKLMS